ncbi:hypothetical protein F444_06929 [Phytophthora nicotianae P1976]|uniref:Uncharacterized protein n=1 Tax=Phytophthora nicotianae P1976 TaxID=1317066 RepID=A0A081AGC8_PHYNI|nr:hypothetical protein F444_06929 [Phytophthora nicotianae P1976]
MRGYAIAAEKSLGQVWRELTKKGWSFRKSLGLSDDRDTSLMNYCRRQGWLEFGPLPPAAQAELTEPATAASKLAPKPRAAAKSTQVPLESAAAAVPRPPCAEAKPSSPVTTVATTSVSKKPATKPAAKKPSAKRCASKRPATASSGSEPARRKRAAVGKTKPTTAQDSAAGEINRHQFADTSPDTAEERVPEVTTTSAEDATGGGTTAGRSLLDAFDSDDFLDALREDRLFGPLESDDLNVGEADWLLGLDSDLEGNEE